MLGGAKGFLLNPNAPFSSSLDEIYGLIQEVHTRFRVCTYCGARRQHNYMGEVGSSDATPAIKLLLRIPIARCAELRL